MWKCVIFKSVNCILYLKQHSTYHRTSMYIARRCDIFAQSPLSAYCVLFIDDVSLSTRRMCVICAFFDTSPPAQFRENSQKHICEQTQRTIVCTYICDVTSLRTNKTYQRVRPSAIWVCSKIALWIVTCVVYRCAKRECRRFARNLIVFAINFLLTHVFFFKSDLMGMIIHLIFK